MQLRRCIAPCLLASVLIGLCLAQDAARKVSKTEGLSAVASKVQPDYPATARQLKIEGAVELEALVAEDGTVEKVSVVSGNPVLTRSAADALKHWRFKPFNSDGKPARAIVPVSLIFKL